MGRGCGKMGGGVGGFWTGKMRSHYGMEGGGNVVPVRGQHEGKGFLPRVFHVYRECTATSGRFYHVLTATMY